MKTEINLKSAVKQFFCKDFFKRFNCHGCKFPIANTKHFKNGIYHIHLCGDCEARLHESVIKRYGFEEVNE